MQISIYSSQYKI